MWGGVLSACRGVPKSPSANSATLQNPVGVHNKHEPPTQHQGAPQKGRKLVATKRTIHDIITLHK